MATKGSQHLTPVRIIWIVGWSIGFALLFVAVETVVVPREGIASIIRPATNGALAGAILGGIHQRVITRWTQGAFIGAILGMISAIIWWIVAETGIVTSGEQGVQRLIFTMLGLTATYAFGGALAAHLFRGWPGGG